MNQFEKQFEKYKEMVNKGLNAYLQVDDNATQKTVLEAMRYSTLNGGKRIRGVLTLAFCKLFDGRVEDALPFACAIEMIHSYSLVHDDLPSMDNDDTRRGQPAAHIKFGEWAAILTGDALLTKAFEIITKSDIDNIKIVEAVSVMSNSAGINGMIGGQVIDIEGENRPLNEETLRELQLLKTGALISASCLLGCIVAGASSTEKNFANSYGRNLGLAFQITDDILDAVGTKEILGKTVKSDENNNKNTFVTVYGLEKSRKIAKIYTQKAYETINEISSNSKYKEFIKMLTNDLLEREK